MKLANILLVLASAQGALSSVVGLFGRDCTGNNCNRAVTGTAVLPNKLPVESRRADCSSFMRATVTPATLIITEYTTVTATITNPIVAKRHADATALDARQVTVSPSAVPPYASACNGANEFSSACSCWGFTRTTTTVAVPVTTTTSTIMATVSVCPQGATQCEAGCVDLQTNPNNCGTCGNSCLSRLCQAGVCFAPRICSTGDDCVNDCFCFEGATGSRYCAPTQLCAANIVCATSLDCAPGGACVKTVCGAPRCKPVAALSTCLNASAPKRLFRRGELKWDHDLE